MNTGRWGERLAAWYLFFHGCRILERNYRYGRWEIDIVARERRTGTLLFVEVKTRANTSFGRPVDAVTASKQHPLPAGEGAGNSLRRTLQNAPGRWTMRRGLV